MTYIEKIAQDGFVIVDSVVDLTTLQFLERQLALVDGTGSQRAGKHSAFVT